MSKRTHNQNTLVLGQWNAECDVCGFKFKSGDLRERWDGYMVCTDDWEERHPSDFFRSPPPEEPIPWTTGESSDAGGTDINGNTFPPTFVDTTDDLPTGTFETNNETIE